jgi:hypothetical protein
VALHGLGVLFKNVQLGVVPSSETMHFAQYQYPGEGRKHGGDPGREGPFMQRAEIHGILDLKVSLAITAKTCL